MRISNRYSFVEICAIVYLYVISTICSTIGGTVVNGVIDFDTLEAISIDAIISVIISAVKAFTILLVIVWIAGVKLHFELP